MLPSSAYLVGGISSRATTHRKGAEQCQESPRPNGLPLVPRVNPDAAAVTRPRRAARSKPNPRINAPKRIWRWRTNSPLHKLAARLAAKATTGRGRRPSQQPGPSALAFGARECLAATNAACAGVGKRGTTLSRGNSRKRTTIDPSFRCLQGRALPYIAPATRSPSSFVVRLCSSPASFLAPPSRIVPFTSL
jgi:hypothetical protein